MRTIIVLLFLVLFLVLSLPFLGIEWIIARFNRRATDLPQLRVVQWAFSVIVWLSGVKLTVVGEENVPKDEPVLYIPNHRSYFDIIITYARCPGRTGYISKDVLKKVPILSIYMERLYCLFLVRDDMRQGMKVILTAIDHIKEGISICVFPEGTRNKDHEHPENLAPFKEGTFKIATKTGCKIVPMAILGTDNILEAHMPWIRPAEVTIVYGKPIDPKALDKETQKHLGAYVQEIVQGMICENL